MSDTQRNPGLDTLRALAILCVMPFHAIGELPESIQPVAQFGWMGVDLFFVLSGYLIGAQLLRPVAEGHAPSLRQFYLRRAWRILPAYLTVLVLYLFAPAWREREGLARAWQFLTFTLNLNIDYAHASAFSHAWSLCVEEHFYLVLPLLVLALRRKVSLRGTAVVASAAFATGILCRAAAWRHLRLYTPGSAEFSFYYLEHIYYPTWARLDGLLCGVLLASAQLFRPRWWQALLSRPYWLLASGGTLFVMSIALFKDRFNSAEGIAATGDILGFPVLAVALGLLLLGSLSPGCLLSKKVPGARFVAELSFSLYLSHKAAIHLVQLALPEFCEEYPLTALGLYAGAAFAIAAALYFTVERPCLRLRNRRHAAVETLLNPAL